ncbi:MAG: MotA/TolQ/ExbB proton channel family protein [Elusimicrobia bacterium]|nr:MotA/TolQ/ExbB proton channel family protein [Elusimicrobiota bacterium]
MDITWILALALTGGDWVVYGLLLCSVLSLAIIIERGVLLFQEEKDFSELRQALIKDFGRDLSILEKTAHRHQGAAARILRTALAQSHHGPAGVEDLLLAASFEEKNRLEKRLLALGTLGNNAPFVGLFGTVLGVIKAFHDLSQASAGPEVVMKGLSEALIATAVGLFVAIPCVVSYNYFQKKAKDLLLGTESLGRFLIAQIRAAKGSP